MKTITKDNWEVRAEDFKEELERIEKDLSQIRNHLQDLVDSAYEGGREQVLSEQE